VSYNIEQTGDVPACLALRRTVFIEEQNVSEADELDNLDAASIHLIARNDDMPVGTARLTIAEGLAKIGRVCVLKAHRGQGLGAAMILNALEIAREQGAAKATLSAQTHALTFYEALGFRAVGPIYDDAGIPHRDMVCTL